MLADPRWVTAQLANRRDADLISERTANPVSPSNQPNQDGAPKGLGRDKGRKGRKNDQTGENTA